MNYRCNIVVFRLRSQLAHTAICALKISDNAEKMEREKERERDAEDAEKMKRERERERERDAEDAEKRVK